MIDRTLARGLFLVAVSLAFGLPSLRYPLGNFSRAGAGLFPLMVSCLLLLIGVVTLIQSRFVERHALEFNYRNIAIILASLCCFALVSLFVNMIAGIVTMVLVATFAASSYSVPRALKISLKQEQNAFAFQKLLGFNLPLY